MNEPSRLAVRAFEVARSGARAHPSISLATAGFAAATLTVVMGGRVGPPTSVIPLTTWLGLMPRNSRGSSFLAAALMVAGILALLALWLIALRTHRSARVNERTVWFIGAAWGAPFIVGPPLLSNDVFTYAAQGLLLRKGLDPYSVGPSALGNVRAVAAVDPSWRSVPSPYGPLATTLQHLAVSISGGSPLGAALVFRAVGVVCIVAIGMLAADLAGAGRRVSALTITILNPLLLLHIVSASHLDGVMCVLLLASIVAANQRRWALGIVLAVAAGAVKAPAFIAVPAIIAIHAQLRHGRQRWQSAGSDVAVAAASTFAVSLAVRNGWGWVHALNTPGLGHTALAPASLVADLLGRIVTAASFDDLAAAGRITALAAAGCIAAYLIWTSRQRPLTRTVGYGMLAIGILSPVVYPWYLLGGVVCLAPTARAAGREWIVLISVVGCLMSPQGFTVRVSTVLTIVTIVVTVGVIVQRVIARQRDPVQADEERPSVTAGG
jgi:hypothetical protein